MIEKFTMMALLLTDRLRERHGERGATATEYSLLVGLIALVLVVGVGLFGTALDTWFTDLGTTVSGWVTP